MFITTPIDPEKIPSHYVLHHGTQLCAHCGASAPTNRLYALYVVPARFGTKAGYTKTFCQRPTYNLAVETFNEGQSITPFCSVCPDFNLSHLPAPPSNVERLSVGGAQEAPLPAASAAARQHRRPVLVETPLEDLA